MRTHVAARAVQLAVVVNVEVDDVDCSAAVVLNNLVGSVVGTSSNDPGLLACRVPSDGDCVLAYILEPNVLQSAMALAVHTFSLIGTDYDVAKSSALAEEEDSVLVTC